MLEKQGWSCAKFSPVMEYVVHHNNKSEQTEHSRISTCYIRVSLGEGPCPTWRRTMCFSPWQISPTYCNAKLLHTIKKKTSSSSQLLHKTPNRFPIYPKSIYAITSNREQRILGEMYCLRLAPVLETRRTKRASGGCSLESREGSGNSRT